MRSVRIVFPFLAAMALIGRARAEPERVAAPHAVAAEDEEYAIGPGTEPLFADMLGSGQTLPGGCTFGGGRIERTSVIATYQCGAGEVELQLLHPEIAPRGGVRTQRFAIVVKSGVPPAGLVDAVAERIRAREAGFEWMNVGGGRTRTTHRLIRVAAASLAAIVVLWAALRLALRRRRRPGRDEIGP